MNAPQQDPAVASWKRPNFQRQQPNLQQRSGQTLVGNIPRATQIQSPMMAQAPGSKSPFDVDIDGLEEKPWRKPGESFVLISLEG